MNNESTGETSGAEAEATTTPFDPLGAALLLVPGVGFLASFFTDIPALPAFLGAFVSALLMGIDAGRLRIGSRKGEFPAPLWCALALVPILWFLVFPAYMAVRAKSRGKPNLVVPAVIVAAAVFGTVFIRGG